MMRAQLDATHERGEPIAALYASEETIYGRYGYGLASLRQKVSLTGDRAALSYGTPLRAGSVRLVDKDEARRTFPRLYDRVRRTTPGFFARSGDWWDLRRLADSAESRGDAGPLNYALAEIDDRPVAYALYRIAQKEEDAGWKRRLHIIEALGADTLGTREIWRFLLEIDWIHEIRASLLPVDHPLFHLVARPDSLNLRTETGLWVRLVDVGAALSGRSYPEDGELVFEVRDAFCPWNEGRWRLAGGAAERTDADADLALDVTVLGSAFLGGIHFAQLAQGGAVEELRPGAIERADGLFRHGLHPWCPEIF